MLLVDCGATSLVALKAQGLNPDAVDAVAVTHLHGDHFGGLPFLILDAHSALTCGCLMSLIPAKTARNSLLSSPAAKSASLSFV